VFGVTRLFGPSRIRPQRLWLLVSRRIHLLLILHAQRQMMAEHAFSQRNGTTVLIDKQCWRQQWRSAWPRRVRTPTAAKIGACLGGRRPVERELPINPTARLTYASLVHAFRLCILSKQFDFSFQPSLPQTAC